MLRREHTEERDEGRDRSGRPQTAPAPAVIGAELLRLQGAAGNQAIVARLADLQRLEDTEPAIESLFGDAEPSAPIGGGGSLAFDGTKGGKYDASLFSRGEKTGKKPDETGPAATEPMVAVDEKRAQDHLAQLATRVERFPALQGSDFLSFMRGYVAAAIKGDAATAQGEMEMAIACLKSLNAFTIGNVVYARQGAATDPAVLADLADQAMQGVVLWSKLNKYKAIETVAGGEKGNSLEASAAGSLFDDLDFGMDYGKHAVLRKQWSIVSQSFVTEARGVVHAQVLEGIDPNSVLTTTEWPVIAKLMRQGVVLAFVVHFFEYASGTDGTPGELVENGMRTIRHPDEWNGLPSVTDWNEGLQDYSATQSLNKDTGEQEDSGYRKRQGAAHFGERDRHLAQEEMRRSTARFVEVDT